MLYLDNVAVWSLDTLIDFAVVQNKTKILKV